ncbi:ABC transporter substrate-binding protein [Paenibacillus sp. y28]|uniref:ABC transporter substrate-binding protein n=1 Tax=Paenibacillus sp. y28 TaxID=3129110 RepID=UPI00301646A8
MKRYGYRTKAVLHLMLCFLCLTACNGATDIESKPAEEETIEDTAQLVVYSGSGDSIDSWNDRFGSALQARFPNYTIKYIQKQKDFGIKELLTSGETIDIYWDSIGGFAAGLLDNGLELDMTPLMKKHHVELSQVEPTVADSVKQLAADKVIGIPIFNNNMVLYYNKDLFDKFGVSYPQDGMTWREASALGEKLTRFDQKQYVGLSSSQTHMLLMNQLSIPFIDAASEKSTLQTDEKWRTYFNTVFAGPGQSSGYVDYMKAHKDTLPYRVEFLQDRELAMFAWLSSIMFVFPEDFKAMNWDMVALPTFEELPQVGSQAYPTYFAVTSMSRQQDQAMKVIQYLLSEEMQTRLSKKGVMPVLQNEAIQAVYGQDSPFKDKNLKASFYNKFAPIPFKSRYDSLALTPYAKVANKVVLTADHNTVFRETAEEVNKKLQEARMK